MKNKTVWVIAVLLFGMLFLLYGFNLQFCNSQIYIKFTDREDSNHSHITQNIVKIFEDKSIHFDGQMPQALYLKNNFTYLDGNNIKFEELKNCLK